MAGSRFKGWDGGLLGGNSLTGQEITTEASGDFVETTTEIIDQGDVRGVYAKHPATTPKYHTGNADVTKEYMARLFVPFASDAAREVFVNTVPQNARALAEHLAVSDETALWGGTTYGLGYIDFLLQSANEQFNEKLQVVDAVGDNYIAYYLGQNPPVFQYSGTLLNSYQDDWRAAFTVLYNDVLRGTMLARRKVVTVLAYDDVMITGSLSNLSQILTADFESMARFNFSMLVKRYDFSSRSPRAQFKPTPVASYPYDIKPSQFASKAIPGVTKSIWAADSVTYTTSNQRKKGSESGVTPSADLEIEAIDTTPDPDVEYINNTIYNATIGQIIAVLENAAQQQQSSDELDDDFFNGPQSQLPPDVE